MASHNDSRTSYSRLEEHECSRSYGVENCISSGKTFYSLGTAIVFGEIVQIFIFSYVTNYHGMESGDDTRTEFCVGTSMRMPA